MIHKVVISIGLFLAVLFIFIIYQPVNAEEGLKKTTSSPVIDGVIEPGEYSYSIDMNHINRATFTISTHIVDVFSLHRLDP